MKKTITFLPALILLAACSTTNNGMQFINQTPSGIKVINVIKELGSRAYQTAEKHCAKYSKVPRILKRVKQYTELDEVQMMTIIFSCIRP